MAAVPIIISPCVIYDKLGRTQEVAAVMGMAQIAGLGVGGGPVYPPEGGGGPDHIWGPTDPRPTPPIANVPGVPGYRPPGDGIWGPPGPWPSPPIYLPPQIPPEARPPEPPPAGTVTPVPPPEGSGGWPVNPVVTPAYVVFNYPGYGPVYVTPPSSPAAPTPTGRR